MSMFLESRTHGDSEVKPATPYLLRRAFHSLPFPVVAQSMCEIPSLGGYTWHEGEEGEAGKRMERREVDIHCAASSGSSPSSSLRPAAHVWVYSHFGGATTAMEEKEKVYS